MTGDAHVLRHLGLIMDGNRRWAKINGLTAAEGHRAGFRALKGLLNAIKDLNIEYVSIYAFSTENWNRSKTEVAALLKLIHFVFKNELGEFHSNNVRLQVAGDVASMPKDIRNLIAAAEEKTRDNSQGTLVVCLNYGGQEEITQATRQLISSGVSPDEVTKEYLEQYLYVPNVPPIDLVIRTSGEQRLSNFMLWRAAYAELMFTNTLWPDLTVEELKKLINDYQGRQRRYGV